MKPRIDRTNLKTTTIRVGKQIFLDVDVAGEPAPVIKWFVVGGDGKALTDTDRLTIENVPYNTKLKIVDGKRADSAKYRIVATNEHGSDEEVVELVVLGPPSKPMGNLIIRLLLMRRFFSAIEIDLSSERSLYHQIGDILVPHLANKSLVTSEEFSVTELDKLRSFGLAN